MKPSEALASNRAAIRHVVESHRARNARVFGSVLHGQDTDTSDLGILVDPTAETTLFDIGAIRHELAKLLGVPVDVLTPNATANCDAPVWHINDRIVRQVPNQTLHADADISDHLGKALWAPVNSAFSLAQG